MIIVGDGTIGTTGMDPDGDGIHGTVVDGDGMLAGDGTIGTDQDGVMDGIIGTAQVGGGILGTEMDGTMAGTGIIMHTTADEEQVAIMETDIQKEDTMAELLTQLVEELQLEIVLIQEQEVHLHVAPKFQLEIQIAQEQTIVT